MAELVTSESNPREQVLALKRKKDWAAIFELGRSLPTPLTLECVALVEEAAFAATQLGEYEIANDLYQEAWRLEATPRRASALAFVAYGELFERRRHIDPERKRLLQQRFENWIDQALRLAPRSIKDLYRLGIYEAQLQSKRDRRALKALLSAIRIYESMNEVEHERRRDLDRYYAKSLYAAARSALRLSLLPQARALCFQCIRVDRDRGHVEPLFKLSLAGKVCLATGELDHAERALRQAVEAEGPRRRDFVYVQLAEVARAAGDLESAKRWVDQHIRVERRSPAVWRLLAEIEFARGELDAALAAAEAAARKDRYGQHLTQTLLGHIHQHRGAPGRAKRAFRKANDVRVKRYGSEHAEALQALEKCELGPGMGRARRDASDDTGELAS